MVVYSQFRDGNVPAGYEQLPVFIKALDCLPKDVDDVRLRCDSAGYQHDLFKYCETGGNERFGRIGFAISCNATPGFKKAVGEVPELQWRPFLNKVKGQEVETGKQWAEVCFVPNAIEHSKKGPAYGYPATREVMQEQLTLAGLEQHRQYPFPTMPMKESKYKVFGTVTNMDWGMAMN